MQFPSQLSPDVTTRAGRMLEAGDVRVTVTSKKSGEHITIRFKAFGDTRDDPDKKNWTRVPLARATHVFIEVPTPDDGWADKVGTHYPKSGRFFEDDNADLARVWAASAAAHWLNGERQMFGHTEFAEEERCGKCGRTLTDPVSIERGIGPECYGKDNTGSQHQAKLTDEFDNTQALRR